MSTLGAKAGTYATKDGVQVAAVWRMVEKLTNKGSATTPASIAGPATRLKVVNQSARQAVVRWQAVEGACGLLTSASEVVREALRLMNEQDHLRAAKLAQLREDVRAGLDSGPATAWDTENVKREGRAWRQAKPASTES